jgi:methionyl aminopeptidase
MIQLKNKDEIAWIRRSGHILAETFKQLESLIDVGIETRELDLFARDFIEKRGGTPAFLGLYDYPASLCVSINEEVIHGIPGKRALKKGDIVSLDLGINLHGYISDAAQTYPVGAITEEREKLLRVTAQCLDRAVAAMENGSRLNDISKSIFDHATENGFSVVRQYCGHGVGISLHEEPQIRNYLGPGPNPKLKPGMVLAIEPMLNSGTWEVKTLEDGWTVVTADGRDSAHFEYTVAVLEEGVEILTPIE